MGSVSARHGLQDGAFEADSSKVELQTTGAPNSSRDATQEGTQMQRGAISKTGHLKSNHIFEPHKAGVPILKLDSVFLQTPHQGTAFKAGHLKVTAAHSSCRGHALRI